MFGKPYPDDTLALVLYENGYKIDPKGERDEVTLLLTRAFITKVSTPPKLWLSLSYNNNPAVLVNVRESILFRPNIDRSALDFVKNACDAFQAAYRTRTQTVALPIGPPFDVNIDGPFTADIERLFDSLTIFPAVRKILREKIQWFMRLTAYGIENYTSVQLRLDFENIIEESNYLFIYIMPKTHDFYARVGSIGHSVKLKLNQEVILPIDPFLETEHLSVDQAMLLTAKLIILDSHQELSL